MTALDSTRPCGIVAPGHPPLHDTFLSMTGTVFACCPAQGAIVCRAVYNQAMLEPALGWVETYLVSRSMQTSYSSHPHVPLTFCSPNRDGRGDKEGPLCIASAARFSVWPWLPCGWCSPRHSPSHRLRLPTIQRCHTC